MDPGEPRPKRRRSSTKDRVRVTRACDACKRKKLRCSGTLPCAGCLRSKAECQYNADYTRGRLPTIPPLQPLTVGHQQPGVADINTPKNTTASPYPQDSSGLHPENSPEPAHEDLEGHYVGPSSGVSFLLRVQKRLHENIAFSPSIPIFNFGDSPLPKYDSSFLVLPTKSEAQTLVARYFDFAFPTHRFLHRPQVEGWLDDFYQRLHEPKSPGRGLGERWAVILMVFAQAKQYLPVADESSGAAVNSIVYFGASEHHLAIETGPVRLSSVQARLAQCFFLLSESRINHCWSLFGITARLAIAIGLHRRRRRDMTQGPDFIEQECRKRVFWAAYSLDNYLSAALGRPRSFHDDDIDQDLPTCAEDSCITPTAILPSHTQTQSIMLAPVCHARLSKIISGILHELYGIKQLSLASQSSMAMKFEAELLQWRKEISSFVDLPSIELLMPIYQRQYTVLNLAYAHAQILLYRPFILKNFAALASVGGRQQIHLQGTIRQYIQSCLTAAMKIVAMVRELCANQRMYTAFWFTHYYAFSAVVVLYVHTIQSSSPNEALQERYFTSGEQAQHDLATCGSKSSFAQRYVVILEELRKEAQAALQRRRNGEKNSGPSRGSIGGVRPLSTIAAKHIKSKGTEESETTCLEPYGDRETAHPQIDTMQLSPGAIATSQLQLPETGDVWIENLLGDGSPDSYVAELTGWGEFDCLASTGLGDFSNLFPPANLDEYS